MGDVPTGELLQVWTYVPPLITATGIIGNILTLATVTNRHCKKSSFTVYLAILAITDTLFLLSYICTKWFKFVYRIDVEITGGPVMCKIYRFVSYLFPFTSAWIIVCLTVERWFCTAFPHKTKTVCRPKTAFIMAGIIISSFTVLCSHVFYGVTYSSVNTTVICNFINEDYEKFVFSFWNWVVQLSYYFLPATLIITANIATVIKVYRSQTFMASSISDLIRRRNRHILIITLVVSITFVVLTAPMAAYLALRPFLFKNVFFFYASSKEEQIFETIGYIGISLNHSINFFLYCVSGAKFRQELKSALCVCKCQFRQDGNTRELGAIYII